MSPSLDPRIYWRRRIVVAAVLATVVLLGLNPPWKSSEAESQATGGLAAKVASTPTASPTNSASPATPATPASPASPTEPVPVAPVPCEPGDVTTSPAVDQMSALAGQPVEIVLTISVITETPCTWNVSSDTTVVKVNSHKVAGAFSGIGSAEPGDVWSTQVCEAAIPNSDLLLDPATPMPVQVTWLPYPAEDSDAASRFCPGTFDWMRPGKYTVFAAALGGEPSSFDFRLRPQR